MKIGLHDGERAYFKSKTKFPNLALMKLSAHHKSKGDTVEWWTPLDSDTYDIIYSSKVFGFTPEEPNLPENTIRGGTGYKDIPLTQTLPPEIEMCKPDYTIYPGCDFAIGYITRGCPNNCRWCVVPQKEGDVHPYSRWQDIVRSDTNKIVLMDNNILSCDYGVSQLAELAETPYKIDLNQGMDSRRVTPEIAEILARVKWIRRLRFSCDTEAQIEPLLRTAELLNRHGIPPARLFVYLMVTADVERAAAIVEQIKRLKNITIYAQPEIGAGIVPSKAQKEFAKRYIYKGLFRKETWREYCEKRRLVWRENGKGNQ